MHVHILPLYLRGALALEVQEAAVLRVQHRGEAARLCRPSDECVSDDTLYPRLLGHLCKLLLPPQLPWGLWSGVLAVHALHLLPHPRLPYVLQELRHERRHGGRRGATEGCR